MVIKLYGSEQSRSFRVLWALEEAELLYDYKQVRLGRTGENGARSESYTQINFQSKVPTLVDGDLVITESAAILNYIAALAPDKGLMPIKDLTSRAHYDEICFFVLSELEQPLWTYAKHSFVLPKEYRLKEIRTTAQWEFAKTVKALEHYWHNKDYAVGNQFTMADILLTHTLRWANNAKFEVPENLLNYINRIFLRPAYNNALIKDSN